MLVGLDTSVTAGPQWPDVPTLVEQHLVGGEPVEMLHIGRDNFCSLNQHTIGLKAVYPTLLVPILGSSSELAL